MKKINFTKEKGQFCAIHNTNLTFASNTSPGRNFPACRKIKAKANEKRKQRFGRIGIRKIYTRVQNETNKTSARVDETPKEN